MARPSRPDSIYRVSLHRNGGHLYAATHPFTVDASGKRHYTVVHWGTVTEDLRFLPGKRYLEASGEVRDRLIFPEGWDLSATRAEPRGFQPAGLRPLPFSPADRGKSFGGVWLLDSSAARFGIREDLAEVLGDASKADDILTLAYYPLLSGMSFVRFPRWQASTKLPSERPLDSMVESLSCVDRGTFRRFMQLRLERYASHRLCAVDSVTRYSFGGSLTDRRWGMKAERIHSLSAVEAVVYSLDEKIPIAYTSYPEAVTDARGMGIFRSELRKKGLEGITVVTDRGYDSLQGLERYYADGPMVMCVDVKQPAVMERILSFGRFRSHPAGMRYDTASRRWYRQYPLASDGLRLNLFFNPDRRAEELSRIDSEILSQQNALREIMEYGITVDDRRSLKRDHYFFNITYDTASQTVASFTPARDTILRTRAASGFYANITSGLSIGPLEAVNIYGLKYDQERFLRQYRSLLDFRPASPGSAKEDVLSYGGQLLMYIGLTLHMHLLNTLRANALDTDDSTSPLSFRTIMELLDEISAVTCVDDGHGGCSLSSLSPRQQRILLAFEADVS